MKKIVAMVVLCICLFCPEIVHATKVVGIGDSITTGFGVKEEENYLSIFCKQLEEKEHQVVTCKNQAIDGITSKQLLLHLKDENFQKEIINTDYLFMSIGGNDFLQELVAHLPTYLSNQDSYPQITVIQNELLENLKLIYEQLRLLNPKMEIFVVPLYNPYYEYLKHNEVLIEQFNEAKTAYVTLSKTQNHVTIAPMLSDILENPEYSNVSSGDRSLDPHPNTLGHAKIASAFIEFVKTKPVVKEEKIIDKTFPYVYVVLSIVVGVIAIIWYQTRK